ncbi:hypothetical protein KIKIMORA_04880 [Brevundimonas phage vB_BpoS-Kikimora]|uniref:Uncharacterized protein n=1 Tax=Brevundimonas phage vB_BpoS-Kikimora TaxID=2948601 RepID=A0A9E7MTY0_9CAUD|nr:hypothetical protein KIKIMORA_04880 [Brevundimonas phage vB_BpoS-Kikimora]
MNTHRVTVYFTARVAVEVTAASHEEAIAKATAQFDGAAALAARAAEDAEEITGYLVDEAGDEDFANSRSYGPNGVEGDPKAAALAVVASEEGAMWDIGAMLANLEGVSNIEGEDRPNFLSVAELVRVGESMMDMCEAVDQGLIPVKAYAVMTGMRINLANDEYANRLDTPDAEVETAAQLFYDDLAVVTGIGLTPDRKALEIEFGSVTVAVPQDHTFYAALSH